MLQVEDTFIWDYRYIKCVHDASQDQRVQAVHLLLVKAQNLFGMQFAA